MSLGRHVYLDSSNAEELLPDIIEGIKNKTYNDSRRQAFDDCTLYWKEEVIKILKDNAPPTARLARIRNLFGIEPLDE